MSSTSLPTYPSDENSGGESPFPKTQIYGHLPEGTEVKLFTLTNRNGLVAKVTNFGAILVSMEIPDKDGKMVDLTHGYDDLEGWLGDTCYFGATVGRFANRIAGGRFSLDGKEYRLATNCETRGAPCHLHGGVVGFNKVLWTGEAFLQDGIQGVALTYESKDGEEGYPGTLKTTVTYSLTDENQLIWKAEATTDKATPINLVSHAFWNLSGDPTTSINDHVLKIEADHYLATNAEIIPTGELASVLNTPMNFTQATAIGERVETDFEALNLALGYDHCWVLPEGEGLKLAATVHDPKSGRSMTVHTDQPGMQFYGGNFLDGSSVGKGGVAHQHRTAFCLETQNFPDAPNQPSFPNSILRPGEFYSHTTKHTFFQ